MVNIAKVTRVRILTFAAVDAVTHLGLDVAGSGLNRIVGSDWNWIACCSTLFVR